jgi:hypothetical protein
MRREGRGDRAELRLVRDYLNAGRVPTDHNGAKTVSLARLGNYEVRLVEFVRTCPTDARPTWLELYSHETQSVIDSCCRYDIDEAVQAAEHLISIARQLDEE